MKNEQHKSNLPKGYFDQLPDRIMERIDREELEKVAPALYSIDRENPYLVPEGYFEDLPVRIRESVAEEPVAASNRTYFDLRIVAAAASVAFLLLAGWSLFENPSTGGDQRMIMADNQENTEPVAKKDLLAEETSTVINIEMNDELAQVVEEEVVEMSEMEIIDAMDPEDINSLGPVVAENEGIEDVETEAIVDYLVDYDVDLEDVIAEL